MIYVNKLQGKVLSIIDELLSKNNNFITTNTYASKVARSDTFWEINKVLNEYNLSLDISYTDKGRISDTERKIIDKDTRAFSFVYLNAKTTLIKDNSYYKEDNVLFVSKDYRTILDYSFIKLS